MAFIIVGIVVVLGGALVMLLATGRRRATTGRLSRETRQRDESTPTVGTELATVDESEEARARADEARAATGAVPAKRAKRMTCRRVVRSVSGTLTIAAWRAAGRSSPVTGSVHVIV